MLGFLLTTLIFIGALVGFQKLLNVEKIKKNWEQYRCRPDVMLMAGLYGHDATENLEYCLKNGFDKRASNVIGPFYTYLSSFTGVLLTFLSNINSLRMTFATLVGSVSQVFSEFSQRMQALLYRFQTSAIRIRFLMGRVFATMYAVIFMGMSGLRATTNFGNTFLFKFLDTFCFDPDTRVEIDVKGEIPIKDVKIGDIFSKTGDKVTATFQFAADGQGMVRLPGNILVSTNHYLLHNSRWIKAEDHPLAQPVEDWSGGTERPLICLNTQSHSFPIGDFVFKDYDETYEGDAEAMCAASNRMNGTKKKATEVYNSEMLVHPLTHIRVKGGASLPASQIKLGAELSHGRVVGIVKKEATAVCLIRQTLVTAGTSIWSEKHNAWKRAFELQEPFQFPTPVAFYNFVVTPNGCVETASGLFFRDYVEVHSPDMEEAYSSVLETTVKAEC